MTDLKQKLEAMRKRCEAATPGPWKWFAMDRHDGIWLRDRFWKIGPKLGCNHHPDDDPITSAMVDADYEFVSKARTEIPALLSALEIAVEALENITKKKPMLVSVREAGDMACEFHIVADQALAEFHAALEEA